MRVPPPRREDGAIWEMPDFYDLTGCAHCPSCQVFCAQELIRDGMCFRCDPSRKSGFRAGGTEPEPMLSAWWLVLPLLVFAAGVVLGLLWALR